MILNPIVCEECKRELQPEDLGIGFNNNDNLFRVCGFCDHRVNVDASQEESE